MAWFLPCAKYMHIFITSKYQQFIVFLPCEVTYNDTNLQTLDRRRCHRASPAVQNTDRSCTSYHCTLSQTNLLVQTRTETRGDSTVNNSNKNDIFHSIDYLFLEQGLWITLILMEPCCFERKGARYVTF